MGTERTHHRKKTAHKGALDIQRKDQPAEEMWGSSIKMVGQRVTQARLCSSIASSDPVVFVEGVRTPFLASLTDFQHLMPHQLLARTFEGILERTGLTADQVDYLCAGTVQQEVRTSNIAKEAAFSAGFPLSTPGHTVTMACISANQAVTSCIGLIQTGQAEVAIAGGVEFCSDQPIKYPRLVRQLLMKAPRARTAAAQQEVGEMARGFSPMSLVPEIPDPREFSTNEVMGHSADRLCEAWGVSRQEQDEFGHRSHTLAATAAAAGNLSDILPFTLPGTDTVVSADNGIRAASLEKLAKLKPAFRKGGSVTAANSSFLSDGATACLLMKRSKADQLGLKPKAILRYELLVIEPNCCLKQGVCLRVPRSQGGVASWSGLCHPKGFG